MDDVVMVIALLAAALLAQPPSDEPSMTAGQLYDGCVSYVAHASESSETLDAGASICAVTASARLASNAVSAAVAESDPQYARPTFCPTQSAFQEGGSDPAAAAARIFIAYVDRNPASRNADANGTLSRALAEAWPCPPR